MLSKIAFLPLFAVCLSAVLIPDAEARERRDDQNEARAQMMAGEVKKLREIEALVIPRMKGAQYIGPEFDPTALVYRLKFIRKGRVIFIDVDGRTGAILRRSR